MITKVNWETIKEPIPARFYSGHFAFTLGEFTHDVPHDPELYSLNTALDGDKDGDACES